MTSLAWTPQHPHAIQPALAEAVDPYERRQKHIISATPAGRIEPCRSGGNSRGSNNTTDFFVTLARYLPPMSGPWARGNPTRVEDVEVTRTADGSVVYDESRERVHYLNETATVVLDLCTGERSIEEIVLLLQEAYELPEPPDQEARECLDHLRAEGLVA